VENRENGTENGKHFGKHPRRRNPPFVAKFNIGLMILFEGTIY